MIETEESMNVDTDGEVYLSTPVTIEMLPSHFDVLVPIGRLDYLLMKRFVS